jgi:hypothetical protein
VKKFVAALTSVLPISFIFCVQILPPSPPPLMRLIHTFMISHRIMQDILVACNSYSTLAKGSNCQLTRRNCVEYSQTALTHVQTTGERGSTPLKGKKFLSATSKIRYKMLLKTCKLCGIFGEARGSSSRVCKHGVETSISVTARCS